MGQEQKQSTFRHPDVKHSLTGLTRLWDAEFDCLPLSLCPQLRKVHRIPQ